MPKVRVPVFGTVGRAVTLNTDANIGAQIGVDLFDEYGNVIGLPELARQVNLELAKGQDLNESIYENQIIDGEILARLADNETITGSWDFTADVELKGGADLYVYDAAGTDYARLSLDGTDANLEFSNVADLNITGITSIQAGAVDVDFDAITATSYGGILEANLLDKTASETVSGSWTFEDASSSAPLSIQKPDATSAHHIAFKNEGAILRWTLGMAGTTADDLFVGRYDNSGVYQGAPLYFPSGGDVWVRDGQALRIYDSTDTDYAQFSHNGANFLTDFVNTGNWLIDGVTNVDFRSGADLRLWTTDDAFAGLTLRAGSTTGGDAYIETSASAGALNFNVPTGANRVQIISGTALRIMDSGNSDWLQMSHDGVDFNFDFQNTTDWNITSITSIQAGAVDVDFDAITATSYGGILEANLLDKSANETIPGVWTFSSDVVFGGGTKAFRLAKPGATTTTDMAFQNELGTDRWRFGMGATTDDNLDLYAYDDAGTFRATVLRFSGTANTLDLAWDLDIAGALEADNMVVGSYTRTANSVLSLRTDTSYSTLVEFREDTADYGFDLKYDGSVNEFHIVAHQLTGGGTALTIDRDTVDMNTFGKLIVNSGATFTSNSSGLDGVGVANAGSSGLFTAFEVQSGIGDVFSVYNDGNVNVPNTLSLGTGSHADGDILLNIDIDRSWTFRQSGAGAGTSLALRAEVDTKAFVLESTTGVTQHYFLVSDAGTPRYRIYDAGGTDYGEFNHNGTDFNTVLSGTSNWNISGAIVRMQSQDVHIHDMNFRSDDVFFPETDGGVQLGGSGNRFSHIYSQNLTLSKDGAGGDVLLALRADEDNSTESANAYIFLSQDGGAVTTRIGTTGLVNQDPNGNTFTNVANNGLAIHHTFGSGNIGIGVSGTAQLVVSTSGVQIIDGSESSPGLKFHGDLDTGIYRRTGNQLGISTGGVAAAIFRPYSMYLREASSAGADIAAYGQLWVRNDTPNTLMFTDDGGNDQEIVTEESGSFTATLTGMTTTVTGTIHWYRTGNQVTLHARSNITGTSNSIQMELQGLPAAITPAGNDVQWLQASGRFYNGGTSTEWASGVIFTADPSEIDLRRFAGTASGLFDTGTWDNSGTKGIVAGWTLTYRLDI